MIFISGFITGAVLGFAIATIFYGWSEMGSVSNEDAIKLIQQRKVSNGNTNNNE